MSNSNDCHVGICTISKLQQKLEMLNQTRALIHHYKTNPKSWITGDWGYDEYDSKLGHEGSQEYVRRGGKMSRFCLDGGFIQFGLSNLEELQITFAEANALYYNPAAPYRAVYGFNDKKSSVKEVLQGLKVMEDYLKGQVVRAAEDV